MADVTGVLADGFQISVAHGAVLFRHDILLVATHARMIAVGIVHGIIPGRVVAVCGASQSVAGLASFIVKAHVVTGRAGFHHTFMKFVVEYNKRQTLGYFWRNRPFSGFGAHLFHHNGVFLTTHQAKLLVTLGEGLLSSEAVAVSTIHGEFFKLLSGGSRYIHALQVAGDALGVRGFAKRKHLTFGLR